MFRITAKKDLCNGLISKGQSFTVWSDSSREPSHADVQEAVKDAGVETSFFNKPSAHSSDWIIEKL